MQPAANKYPQCHASSKPAPPARLLVIDDQLFEESLLKRILNGFVLFFADHGLHGLELARRELPHLILLDIMMPELDGFEVCAQLKADSATAHIPVIFLSCHTTPQEKVKGFELGAVDYITKPFFADELRTRVNSHLGWHNRYANLQQRLLAYENSFGPLGKPANMPRDAQRIQRVCDILRAEIAMPPSLDKLAWQVGTNRTTLNQDFQRLMGVSVYEWLREYRCQEAARLLRESDLSIGEISVRLGYQSQASFSRLFGERFGCSPRDYRARP